MYILLHVHLITFIYCHVLIVVFSGSIMVVSSAYVKITRMHIKTSAVASLSSLLSAQST